MIQNHVYYNCYKIKIFQTYMHQSLESIVGTLKNFLLFYYYNNENPKIPDLFHGLFQENYWSFFTYLMTENRVKTII
jgi:hypothetical protein